MSDAALKRFLESRRTLLVCLLLATTTFGIYWQVSRFEFTNYDEFIMILKNPYVLGGLTLQGVTWALTTSWFEYWHPLTWLSHMLDCELFGLNQGWPHLVNLGFHVANTLLLFAILQRMTGARQGRQEGDCRMQNWRVFWCSAMVAALFALHPLHVESVAWIAERKDVLSALFFMLSLWAYVRNSECRMQNAECRGGKVEDGMLHARSRITPHASRFTFHVSRFYLLSLFFFALGLMCKPMLVTLPFVLLLLDYWPLRRFEVQSSDSKIQTPPPVPPSRLPHHVSRITHHASRITFQGVGRLVLEKLPFLALTVASSAITYLGAKAGGNILSADRVPWGLRLANVPVSYVRYLGKMIWPADLIPLYPMPSHWAGWQVGGAAVVLVLITLFVVLRARSAPYLIVGWLIFVGVLLPTIGLVQVGAQSIADRYTYIPSIGIFIAVVWAAAEWGSTRSRVAVLAGAAAVVLVLFGCVTWVQAGYWRNSLTLWTHCLAVSPDNLVARYNLGYVLQHSGKTSDAIAQYQAALRLKPDHLDANLNLGIALVGSRRAREATNYLATAVRLKPDYARAWGALGLALYELGDYAGAVTHCAEAIRLDPDTFGPYVDMGRALSAQGKSDEALRYYAEGLRLSPGLAQTHYYLGLEWMKRRAFAQAEASFAEAVRLAPGWAEARAQQQHALDEVTKR